MNKFLLKVYINKKQYMIESNRLVIFFFLIFRCKRVFQSQVFFFFFLNLYFTNSFEILNAFSSWVTDMTGEAIMD